MATKRTVTLELPAGITSMEDMNEEQRSKYKSKWSEIILSIDMCYFLSILTKKTLNFIFAEKFINENLSKILKLDDFIVRNIW